MNVRERLRWFGRVVLVLFILSSTAFLSAITAMRLAIQGREVEMPALVGKKAGEAQAATAERELGFRVADRVYSDLPVDLVVRQSPPPGTRVKVGQRAHVVLSLGPRQLPIPQVQGKSLRAARLELLRSGLQVGEITSCHLPGAEPDLVVRQSPPAGQMETGSPRVNLLVSLGEEQSYFVMPPLVGLSVGEAQRRIFGAGLRLGKINVSPSPDASRGTVLQQSPAPGSRIPAGAGVELQVAE